MRLLRAFAATLVALALLGCSTTQDLQKAADRNVLSYTVGKPYEQIAATRATTPEAIFQDIKAYGRLIGQSQLAGGDTVYKHIQSRETSRSGVDLGLLGSSTSNTDYALLYFRVGPDGVIRDYANGVVPGESVSCVEYIGGLFTNCDNAQQLTRDIAQMDAAVLTSSGQPLSSWQ